jgi:hypothetical protein
MEPVDVGLWQRYGNVRGVSNLGAAISHNVSPNNAVPPIYFSIY